MAGRSAKSIGIPAREMLAFTSAAQAKGHLPALPPGTGFLIPEEIIGKDPATIHEILSKKTTFDVALAPQGTHRSWFQDILGALPRMVGTVAAGFAGPGAFAAAVGGSGLSLATREQPESRLRRLGSVSAFQPLEAQERHAMAFDDFFGDFGDFLGDLVSEVDFGEVASFGMDLAQNFLQPATALPVATRPPVPMPRGPMPPIARLPGAAVGRSFFNKWPNLSVAIQRMRNAGQNVTRGRLYSMLKRFGPEFLISAGILTAAAVSELAIAGPGHRRMNAANSKALRRAARRIKSFHRLCTHTDLIRTKRSRGFSRCGSCRKSPCRC